ncbi:MAG: helix-hairpin-helix domain-containing protein, partial [Kiritimatiellae bacterium]|nr:helix-hairpin-helix domain-containing protein [Kiritimatiellia bacterium]
MDERAAYIALNMMEKIGPVTVRALVEHLGSAAAIFDADVESLKSVRGVGPELAGAILRQRHTLD